MATHREWVSCPTLCRTLRAAILGSTRRTIGWIRLQIAAPASRVGVPGPLRWIYRRLRWRIWTWIWSRVWIGVTANPFGHYYCNRNSRVFRNFRATLVTQDQNCHWQHNTTRYNTTNASNDAWTRCGNGWLLKMPVWVNIPKRIRTNILVQIDAAPVGYGVSRQEPPGQPADPTCPKVMQCERCVPFATGIRSAN